MKKRGERVLWEYIEVLEAFVAAAAAGAIATAAAAAIDMVRGLSIGGRGCALCSHNFIINIDVCD